MSFISTNFPVLKNIKLFFWPNLIFFYVFVCIVYVFAGVLWLSVISEFTYIGLLGMGFLLMWLEVLCSHKEMHSLKINAYAAICTVLSGETQCRHQFDIVLCFSITLQPSPSPYMASNPRSVPSSTVCLVKCFSWT